MSQKLILILFVAWLTGPYTGSDGEWGFFMHRRINRSAVFTLPPEMIGFYKQHIDEITRRSVDPDRRRHILPGEAARHYIDLDRFESADSLPVSFREAVIRHTRDTLEAHGLVPWHIERLRHALTNAFRLCDGASVIRISADLGHYIGDAHVPLHTTSNYDGESTGQTGIHALWESRLPELFFETYELFTGPARYLDDPRSAVWHAVLEAHALVDSVLQLEHRVHEETGSGNTRGFDYRGLRIQGVYHEQFARKYHGRLNRMVERQTRRSIALTGDMWYSCWVDAGQPDLSACRVEATGISRWRQKYDSLRRHDSLVFQMDHHLNSGQGE